MNTEDRFLTFWRENGFPTDCVILAAVSGGADSMCMLRLLMKTQKRLGISVACAHYDHALRGEESREDAAYTARWCREHEIPFYGGSGDVARRAAEEKRSIEETAREMRYAFLRETAGGIHAEAIATAHNADDNAETVLWNLIRGTGLRGMGGIPVRRDDLIRPILFLTREEVETYDRENGIEYRTDSTNETDDHTRNRIRHHVMPELRRIRPDVSGQLLRACRLMRADDAYLTELAAAFLREEESGGTVSASRLGALPEPVASRCVRLLFPGSLTEKHIEAVLKLCRGNDPSGRIELPDRCVRREYDRLTTEPLPEEEFSPVILEGEAGSAALDGTGLRVRWFHGPANAEIYKSFTVFCFKAERICGNMTVRPRMTGDRLHPGGTEKSVKRWMIEKKIPAARRKLIPVIADEAGCIAVWGLGQDRRTWTSPGDDGIWVRFEGEEQK